MPPPKPPRGGGPPKLTGDLDKKTLRDIEIAVSSCVFLVNIVEIIIIKRIKRKKNFDRLLMSLSTADMLYGLLNGLVHTFEKYEIQQLLDAVYVIHMFFILASILHLISIAGDRLFAVSRPFLHRAIINMWIFFGVAKARCKMEARMKNMKSSNFWTLST